jgi:hypothetical protein
VQRRVLALHERRASAIGDGDRHLARIGLRLEFAHNIVRQRLQIGDCRRQHLVLVQTRLGHVVGNGVQRIFHQAHGMAGRLLHGCGAGGHRCQHPQRGCEARAQVVGQETLGAKAFDVRTLGLHRRPGERARPVRMPMAQDLFPRERAITLRFAAHREAQGRQRLPARRRGRVLQRAAGAFGSLQQTPRQAGVAAPVSELRNAQRAQCALVGQRRKLLEVMRHRARQWPERGRAQRVTTGHRLVLRVARPQAAAMAGAGIAVMLGRPPGGLGMRSRARQQGRTCARRRRIRHLAQQVVSQRQVTFPLRLHFGIAALARAIDAEQRGLVQLSRCQGVAAQMRGLGQHDQRPGMVGRVVQPVGNAQRDLRMLVGLRDAGTRAGGERRQQQVRATAQRRVALLHGVAHGHARLLQRRVGHHAAAAAFEHETQVGERERANVLRSLGQRQQFARQRRRVLPRAREGTLDPLDEPLQRRGVGRTRRLALVAGDRRDMAACCLYCCFQLRCAGRW